MPFFSVITPTYNRPDHTLRSIRSCLDQSFTDVEVVVVDDCSTDDTAAQVAAVDDPRVKLVRHTANMGHWQGRNTGVDNATGTWCIFLDSDEELLPGALQTIADYTRDLPADIGRLGFMYRYDHGGTSPDPALSDEVVDYAGFVRWLGRTTGVKDFLPVTRRDTFEHHRYPQGRRFGAIYHFDFSRDYKTWFHPDVLALACTNVANRNTTSGAARMLRDAETAADVGRRLMADHGPAVAAIDYDAFRYLAAGASKWAFLAGRRADGARFTWAYLRRRPWVLKSWGLLISGLVGPETSAWLRSRVRHRTNVAPAQPAPVPTPTEPSTPAEAEVTR